jgi:hypothetical protein
VSGTFFHSFKFKKVPDTFSRASENHHRCPIRWSGLFEALLSKLQIPIIDIFRLQACRPHGRSRFPRWLITDLPLRGEGLEAR